MAEKFGFTAATMLRASQALISGGLLHRQGYKLTVAHRKQSISSIHGTVYIVTCCSLTDGFVPSVEKMLAERGIQYQLVDVPRSDNARLPRILSKVAAEKPAGIVLRVADVIESVEAWLRTTPLPLVAYAQGLRETGKSSVQIDHYRATEKALVHLYELGHRRIALFFAGQNSASIEREIFYRAVCHNLGLKESAENIWRTELFREDILREALLAAHRRHPEVTAILARDEIASLITRFFSVPKEISVIGFGNATSGLNTQPPLTMMAFRDPEVLAHWACTDLISQIEAVQSEMPTRRASTALFVPDLIRRKSTRAISARKSRLKAQAKTLAQSSHPSQTWQNVYPFLRKKSGAEWRPLELSKLANHSMTRNHGWLGAEPLEHFASGLRSIHGVPFQVLQEKRNGGRAVITFRSPRAHSVKGKLLPTALSIPVKLKPKALYFLHGCGHAKPIPFAQYVMHFASGRKSSVSLVPLGLTRGTAPKFPKHLQPNIQDWWFDYEHRDFPHAHRVSFFNVSAPAAYERFLYSLQWINPRPKDEVHSIEVRVDPEAGPSLAVIAVTALL